MRYLILSDLHANWEALDAVIQDAGGSYDRALCCGDLVGYGADPDPVVEWVRRSCPVVVRGNHDRACTGQEDLEWFNPIARVAALWTQQHFSPENSEYVRSLPQGPLIEEGLEVLHGSPLDEDEYVTAPTDAVPVFDYLESRLAFFGHTHLQGGFIWNQSRVETIGCAPSRKGRMNMEVDPSCAYLINPGSVGQPRDGDPRAAYALYDSGRCVVTFCRVRYNIAVAQKKIREAGLPMVLADRLSMGR